MRISDWSSDVCSSDLPENVQIGRSPQQLQEALRLGVEIDVEQDVHVGAGALAQGFYVVAPVAHMAALDIEEIGRASCRERVCQYVYISVVAVSCNTNKTMKRALTKTKTTKPKH